ncbi:proteasome activator pa28 REG alpha/beta subunit [Pilatotrama ljubarskyi]|nr:proteasome activator pa28 REG alpha/beta subunit [Pilatotrama ljubarskyi]
MSSKVAVDKKLQKELDEFREKVKTDAERVIFEKFPQKKLIDSTSQPTSPFHLSHAPLSTDATVYPPPSTSAEPEAKKRKLESGGANGVSTSNDASHAKHPGKMLSNKHTMALHEHLKRECEELADLCDKVKLWINLSMPNGDNFGVQIQEDVLSEIHRSQESAYNLRDAARQDYLTRAKICSKIMKYPHLDDYATPKVALKEHDEKQLYIARQNLYDLRSIYAVITDMLHKNIEKIRSPKGNNASTMY